MNTPRKEKTKLTKQKPPAEISPSPTKTARVSDLVQHLLNNNCQCALVHNDELGPHAPSLVVGRCGGCTGYAMSQALCNRDRNNPDCECNEFHNDIAPHSRQVTPIDENGNKLTSPNRKKQLMPDSEKHAAQPDNYDQRAIVIELSKDECTEETLITWHNDTFYPALMKLGDTSLFNYKPDMKLYPKKPFVHCETFSQILQTHDIINIMKEFYCTSNDDRSLEVFLKDSKENICAAWPKGGVPHEVIK